jgi:hypothetical protein
MYAEYLHFLVTCLMSLFCNHSLNTSIKKRHQIYDIKKYVYALVLSGSQKWKLAIKYLNFFSTLIRYFWYNVRWKISINITIDITCNKCIWLLITGAWQSINSCVGKIGKGPGDHSRSPASPGGKPPLSPAIFRILNGKETVFF